MIDSIGGLVFAINRATRFPLRWFARLYARVLCTWKLQLDYERGESGESSRQLTASVVESRFLDTADPEIARRSGVRTDHR